MNWIHHATFDSISTLELYEILKLRQDVFIIEQDCIYKDIDNLDQASEHLVLKEHNIVAAYARIVPANVKYKEYSIGRIVVNPAYRGRGLGKGIVLKSLELLKQRQLSVVRIEAQAHLRKFYHELGFKDTGEVYELDGIPHIEMLYRLIKNSRN
jgi:ElaA protein